MKIEVFRQNYYGKFFYYPINDNAKMLCKLLNQKSLTDDNIKIIKDFKWEVVVKND